MTTDQRIEILEAKLEMFKDAFNNLGLQTVAIHERVEALEALRAAQQEASNLAGEVAPALTDIPIPSMADVAKLDAREQVKIIAELRAENDALREDLAELQEEYKLALQCRSSVAPSPASGITHTPVEPRISASRQAIEAARAAAN